MKIKRMYLLVVFVLASLGAHSAEIPQIAGYRLLDPSSVESFDSERFFAPRAGSATRTFIYRSDGAPSSIIYIVVTAASPGPELRRDAIGSMILQTSLEPGFPEGSLTGLPLGREVWHLGPRSRPTSGANWSLDLVVLDDRFFCRISFSPQPVDPAARSAVFPTPSIAAAAEFEGKVRSVVSWAHLALWDAERLTPQTARLAGRATPALFAPGGTVADASPFLTGARTQDGVTRGSLGGRSVVLAEGAREMTLGGRRIALSGPIVRQGPRLYVPLRDLQRVVPR